MIAGLSGGTMGERPRDAGGPGTESDDAELAGVGESKPIWPLLLVLLVFLALCVVAVLQAPGF